VEICNDPTAHLPSTVSQMYTQTHNLPFIGGLKVQNRAIRLIHKPHLNVQANMALYPAIEPFATGMLPVSDVHTVYYEICGNPRGEPVLFLHGGPGGGT
jgi:hypothetical protein